MEDNQACIAMSNNPITHKRTKHIDVRYHFVREKVESKEVELCASYGINCCGSYIMIRSTSGGDANIRMT
ncbi:retrotransposon protein [Nannochloropsis gaditana]|uniref:Retrotransposon protein n=1 Tax=Nannochloropsis gaditana TaxID=72520 RepID=W7TIW4_9STRA|nr:retrotransposon protein [Nannochloropsis gaditana]